MKTCSPFKNVSLNQRQDVSQLPIGVFDSGVGGLTVLRAMLRHMPEEEYLYLGDTARLPYGSKSHATIVRYSLQTATYLVEQGIKLLVIACNTATAAALPVLRKTWPHIPIIGVVEPGAQAACQASASGHIAVIATRSTIDGGAYQRAILRHWPEASVSSLSCPLFVPLAEEGWFNGPIVESIASYYLSPLFAGKEAPDCLVLGCTHYPLLAHAIRAVIGPKPVMVDSAATTAEAVRACLQAHHLTQKHPRNGTGNIRFFTTDDSGSFARTGSMFLGMPVLEKDVCRVDL